MTALAENLAASTFAQLPPHSIDAEAAMVGSLMRCSTDDPVVAECRALVRREHFYQVDHAIMFDAICKLADGGKPLEPIHVREQLVAMKLLEEVGGTAYLAQVYETVMSGALAAHFAGIVRDLALGRFVIDSCNKLLRDAYGPRPQEGYIGLVKRGERLFAKLAVAGAVVDSIQLSEAVELVCAEKRDPKIVRRIKTGLTDLDNLTGGLPVGKFIIIGGNAGMGKSQLGKQLVLNIAATGTPCAVVSIEEDRRKIGVNVLANLTDVENRHLTNDAWTADDWQRVVDASARVKELPIRLADAVDRLSDIEHQISRLALKHGCKVIIVDHIHLVDAETNENRERQVSLISKALKSLAKRLDVALVGLCQLNRGGERDASRRPVLRDLRDSGSLEADGDLILLLYREDYFKCSQPGYIATRRLEALVRKNKDGPMGDVPLYFDGDHQRITDWNDGLGGELPF